MVSPTSVRRVAPTGRATAAGVSVLLPVYRGDDPGHLARALDSLAGQTVPADEIVVVEDGPIGSQLSQVLDRAAGELPIRRVPLSRNLGMGCAMAVGVDACRQPWIARMDADDVCRPDRLEVQLRHLADHPEVDVLGSWITEFDGDERQVYAERRTPVGHDEIRRFARSRNPMNHMTVMFRREAAVAVGGYDLIIEDYYLWARMLHSGAIFANVPEPLVNVRAGRALMGRRGGLRYALHLTVLFTELRRLGFISRSRLWWNVGVAVPVRLLPARPRGWVYRRLLRRPVR